MPLATVLIPTHDHGPTIAYAIRSALGQTVADLEVFVVGDGVPDITRQIMSSLAREDRRVRFFDNPKGARHGELHRHAALQEAQGEIVCYLSDDDLWLPDHVARLHKMLASADFAHSLPFFMSPDDVIGGWIVDLALPHFVERHVRGINCVPLSCAAHTLAAYRRLPFGWQTTPAGTYTDLYMWQQFLAVPGCRALSGSQPTTLHFSSVERADWPTEARVAELAKWASRSTDPVWRHTLTLNVLDSVVRERARVQAHAHVLELQVSDVGAQLQNEIRQRDTVRAEVSTARAETEALRLEAASLRSELGAVYRTRTWRVRNWILQRPGLSAVLRWAARVLVRSSVH